MFPQKFSSKSTPVPYPASRFIFLKNLIDYTRTSSLLLGASKGLHSYNGTYTSHSAPVLLGKPPEGGRSNRIKNLL